MGIPLFSSWIFLAEIEIACHILLDARETGSSVQEKVVIEIVADTRNLARCGVVHAIYFDAMLSPERVNDPRLKMDALTRFENDSGLGLDGTAYTIDGNRQRTRIHCAIRS